MFAGMNLRTFPWLGGIDFNASVFSLPARGNDVLSASLVCGAS